MKVICRHVNICKGNCFHHTPHEVTMSCRDGECDYLRAQSIPHNAICIEYFDDMQLDRILGL